jgi:hypothetical protein
MGNRLISAKVGCAALPRTKVYSGAFAGFEAWCVSIGISMLPLAIDIVKAYLAWMCHAGSVKVFWSAGNHHTHATGFSEL